MKAGNFIADTGLLVDMTMCIMQTIYYALYILWQLYLIVMTCVFSCICQYGGIIISVQTAQMIITNLRKGSVNTGRRFK